MSPDLMLILALGALAGGFINGLAGFGTALFALGFWLQVLPPIQAVAILQVVSLVTGAQGLWMVRAHLLAQPRRLARFLVPALFGIPIGIYFLQYVEPHVLKRKRVLILAVTHKSCGELIHPPDLVLPEKQRS